MKNVILKINFQKFLANSGGKRVIHEYHRISIQPEKISSNMVIVLKALPS